MDSRVIPGAQTPEEVAERYHRMNKKAIEDLGINFSLFTKTTTQNHFDVVHDVFTRLMEHGYLYRQGALQYYCPKCSKFLPDRYVEGRCKKCGDERARGDQCEKCGATYEAGELGNHDVPFVERPLNSGRLTTIS